MDEIIEIIPVQIPCNIYDRQIVELIDALLVIDERLFQEESEKSNLPPDLASQKSDFPVNDLTEVA